MEELGLIRAPRLIVSGPTASGKSALGVRLAKELNAEVVNADSVQVYRDFNIGSAKPKEQEQAGITHHLLDILSPRDSYNAGQFSLDVKNCIETLSRRGKRAVIVGGTTLYIQGLIESLSELPPVDKKLREGLWSRQAEDLYEELQIRDARAAENLHPNDKLRVARALEILLTSKAANLQDAYNARPSHSPTPALIIILWWNRQELYTHIDQRAAQMLERGLLDETAQLLEIYGESCSVFNSLGYSQCVRHIKGDLLEAELRETIARDTRRFAKRQLSYWRNEPRKKKWDIEPNAEQIGNTFCLGGETKVGAAKSVLVESIDFYQLKHRIQERFATPLQRPCVWHVDAQSVLG